MRAQERDIVRGVVAGAAAGLLAAFVMNNFQSLWGAAEKQLSSSGEAESLPGGEPATEKAADKVAEAATGEPVPEKAKGAAGQAVHYATGAALGAIYGALAEVAPFITSGFGAAYGTLINFVLDEGLAPALKLGPNPFKVPLKTHAYGAASHSVFGVALELGRRGIRSAI